MPVSERVSPSASRQYDGDDLEALLARIATCERCAEHLPLGPRPVLQAHESARVLIAGQAPGKAAHRSGQPFDDASGDRLRAWLGVSRAEFHDPRRFAIVPAGFCYPGRGTSGDAPPRPECAPLWLDEMLARLSARRLTVVVGHHAQRLHLGEQGQAGVTATVRAWREFLPSYLPLPHPSPRNNGWLARHPWFEAEVIPALRSAVAEALR